MCALCVPSCRVDIASSRSPTSPCSGVSICCAVAGATIFFFFQAEDGIRDLTVTGVQTCALPISFVRAARTLEKFRIYKDGEGDTDEQIGVNIVKRALEEPMRLIAQNAGKEGAIDRKSVV